jgi:hypothetical protein
MKMDIGQKFYMRLILPCDYAMELRTHTATI